MEPVRYDGKCEIAKGKVLQYDLYYVTDGQQMPHVMEWATQQAAIGLDIETGGLNPFETQIATLQVGNVKSKRAYVIDVRCVSAEALQPLFDLLTGRKVLKVGMNLDFECRFLLHHYGLKLRRLADVQVAELILRAGLWPVGHSKDPEDIDGLVGPAYGATSLKRLCEQYLGVSPRKDDAIRLSFLKTPPGTHNQAQIQYAAGDVIYPFEVMKHQRKDWEDRALRNILEIEFEFLPTLAETQLRGIGLDAKAWRQLWQEAATRQAVVGAQLDEMFRGLSGQAEIFDRKRPTYRTGRDLNYDSPQHVRWAIQQYCKKIGWPIEVVVDPKRVVVLKKQYGRDYYAWLQKRRDRVEWDDVPNYVVDEALYCILLSVKKDVLKLAKLRKQLPAALVDLLVEYSELQQRISAFGIEFLNKHVNPTTGRVHARFHQAVLVTGRLSSQPNLQNPPRDARYRACFKPAPGYKYVIADYSQIEPRLSAQVSNDAVYVQTFLDNDDIYCRVAQVMTGDYPDKKTPEGAIRRQQFKTIVLAEAYRMGPALLRDRLTLALEKEIEANQVAPPSFDDAKELHKQFFVKCSGIAAFQQQCEDLAKSKERRVYDRFLKKTVTWVEGPCGRKRFFPPGYLRVFTEAPNAPIQGGSATITKAAACLVQLEIDRHGYDAFIANLVHDEIIWEVREAEADEFAVMAKAKMEEAGRTWITRVPVKAEYPKGTNGVVDCWLKEAV